VLLFNSNDIYPVEAERTFYLAQHRDIFYLSELIKKRVFAIFPDAPYEHLREIY
jgi:Xaa-Pro aminopeptidase